jgi:hypothetical protein
MCSHPKEKRSNIFREWVKKMNREFNVVIERDADGYFVASVPTPALRV